MEGYIKLHRSMLDWEWYQDANTARVFLHLLLVANWKPGKWHGVEIGRGQRLTSYAGIAKEIRLSVKNVRTAISHLKSTGEVAIKSTNRYLLITIENYDKYQALVDEDGTQSGTQNGTQPGNMVAGKWHASGTQVATNEERKERKEKEEREKNFYSYSSSEKDDEAFMDDLREWRLSMGLPAEGVVNHVV